MSVLVAYFDSSVNHCSPVQPDFSRVVNHDEDGNEVVTYVEFDYPSFQKSNGFVLDWSLDSLLKAGINPNFPIRTGLPTRLEGISDVSQFASVADSILADENKSE